MLLYAYQGSNELAACTQLTLLHTVVVTQGTKSRQLSFFNVFAPLCTLFMKGKEA